MLSSCKSATYRHVNGVFAPSRHKPNVACGVQKSVPPANRRIVAADPSFGTPQDPDRLSRTSSRRSFSACGKASNRHEECKMAVRNGLGEKRKTLTLRPPQGSDRGTAREPTTPLTRCAMRDRNR